MLLRTFDATFDATWEPALDATTAEVDAARFSCAAAALPICFRRSASLSCSGASALSSSCRDGEGAKPRLGMAVIGGLWPGMPCPAAAAGTGGCIFAGRVVLFSHQRSTVLLGVSRLLGKAGARGACFGASSYLHRRRQRRQHLDHTPLGGALRARPLALGDRAWR